MTFPATQPWSCVGSCSAGVCIRRWRCRGGWRDSWQCSRGGHAWLLRSHSDCHNHKSGPAVDGATHPHLLCGTRAEWHRYDHHDPVRGPRPIRHARAKLFLWLGLHPSQQLGHPRSLAPVTEPPAHTWWNGKPMLLLDLTACLPVPVGWGFVSSSCARVYVIVQNLKLCILRMCKSVENALIPSFSWLRRRKRRDASGGRETNWPLPSVAIDGVSLQTSYSRWAPNYINHMHLTLYHIYSVNGRGHTTSVILNSAW